ncbi:Cro/Cl family transcriptional regulator [Vibrio fluvialis]|uniref:Cro/CI family transcriptional regulator n=1 Tax=Vibrio fluvialis TaxID=676 RepID=UPI000CEB7E99|nr:Cro/CI family transcriptional regulator [Vibrio fluvialis]AVH33420.1 Cro/Cl family transcriptional regulator [Vibrio fluvialis]ELO4022986.1 Cro/Cl family transcriptional regulator [Vibrio fluvialis]ELV8725700.1 Cro/Cl family transcriptional regulator [Vibrio fluvialis]EMC0409422.1 Cro/Cl family transcriptional regulator [Vibrio fluvialis]MBY8066267.1 Cro/Cl family transcriptional regulator [Vibrio fluvialis]
MKTRDAIKYFGTAVALARSLGISKQSISRWGEDVPPRRAFELERITLGKLKADFTPPQVS